MSSTTFTVTINVNVKQTGWLIWTLSVNMTSDIGALQQLVYFLVPLKKISEITSCWIWGVVLGLPALKLLIVPCHDPLRHVHTLPHFLSKCSLHSTTCPWRTGPRTFRPGPPCRPCTPAGPARPCLPGSVWPCTWGMGYLRQAWKVHALYTHQATRKGGGVAAVYRGVPRAYCSSNYPLSLEIYVWTIYDVCK